MLPVDAQITSLTPNSFALLISTVLPLSLNEQVGFTPSYLSKIFLSFFDSSNGVPPSFNETTFFRFLIGKNGQYFQ